MYCSSLHHATNQNQFLIMYTISNRLFRVKLIAKMTKNTRQRLLLVSITLFCLGTVSAQHNKTAEKHRAVENGLLPYVPVKGLPGWNIYDRMRYYNVQGLSIAVIKDYKIDWAKGYGMADTLQKIPVTTETMFSAGSVSKLVMATAALRLVQEGRLSLDAPINDYLTSWKIPDNEFTQKTPVTLRMLLSHTAGTSQSSYWGFTPDKKNLPTIVEILRGAPLAESRPVVVNSAPGTAFRYSGGGSMIAQMAIMDVTNSDFAEFVAKTVFQPLGMEGATLQQPLPAKFSNNASWGYSAASWYKGMPYVYPQLAAAGLYATPTDLAKFIIDLQESYRGKGKILRQSMAREMLTAQAPISDGTYKEQIALGAFLLQRSDNTNSNGQYFEHQGANAGFITYVMGSIEGGNGVVIMLNTGDDFNGIGKEIRRSVAQVYHWCNFLPAEIIPVTLDTATLDRYAGRYRSGIDEVVYLRREKNYLIENINEGMDIYGFPVAKDTLILTDFGVKGWFTTDKSGQIRSLQTVFQDKPMPRMSAEEFTPSEHLKAKRYAAAKEGFRTMNLNEYQITYLAYDMFNKKPADLLAVQAVLEVALEQHPTSAIVYSRLGDYYSRTNDAPHAIESYRKAIELDPADQETKEKLNQLTK